MYPETKGSVVRVSEDVLLHMAARARGMNVKKVRRSVLREMVHNNEAMCQKLGLICSLSAILSKLFIHFH